MSLDGDGAAEGLMGREFTMTTLRERDEETAKKKGLMAGAAMVATGVAAVAAGPMLAVVGLVWLGHRAFREHAALYLERRREAIVEGVG